ncbi:L,D-transpeptidase [Amaricoccus solimangrovi]|uniref:L,D-transpeptidase n=1 Tax=Amaricoccus solimangrovi TaxID=2589815 RepID=A0A501WQW3_9RHOB|nr:L,D-transpeptidase [Amaricoccus solimangrovi]TPE51748.1 L,D-transpeptidase [Amaricoccus solimangrovi]
MPRRARLRLAASLLLLAALGACARPEPEVARAAPVAPPLSEETRAMYAARTDGEREMPAIEDRWLSDEKARREVDYWTDEKPGTIVVDPWANRLYYVLGDNRAIRYTVGVGKDGKGFAGEGTIPYTREWPRWTPTPEMLERDPDLYEPHRGGMEGGPGNPLGARALYLFQDGKDTLYRIHGTPYPWTVGEADSSGCVRLFNQDADDLYQRVRSGTKVVVLGEAESGRGTLPPGAVLPPAADLLTSAPAPSNTGDRT